MGHSISEHALAGKPYPPVGEKRTVDGFEFEVTEELLESVRAYVAHVQTTPWLHGYHVESKVNYSRSLAVPYALAFGTADCWGFSQEDGRRVLEVKDLKMGRKAVSPIESTQMTLYAAGVLDSLYPALLLPRDHLVRFTIFQPRLSKKPFQWLTTVGWVEDRALALREPASAAVAYKQKTANQETWNRFPEMTGGHCHYCGRKSECGAFQTDVHNMAGAAAAKNVQWNPRYFELKSAVNTWFEEAEAQALEAALSGAPLPGTKLVKGRAGSPQFAVPREQLREAAKAMGIESEVVALEEVWKTPAKVRDAFKKYGVQDATLMQYITRPEAAPVLASASDPRPEVKKGADVSAFTGVARSVVL